MSFTIVHDVTPTLQSLLQGISDKLSTIISNQQKEQISMAALDDQITALTIEVANNTTVEASALTLIRGLKTQLATALAAAAAAGATPVQLASLTSLVGTLTTSDAALAAAVGANITPPVVGP